MTDLFRSVRLLLLPLLLVGAYYGLSPYFLYISPPWLELLPWVPYLFAAIITLLGWHFHSSRAILVTAIILMTAHWLNSPQLQDPLLHQLLLALVPLNLVIIGFYREQSLLSMQTLGRLLLVLSQLALVAWLLQFHRSELEPWLQLQPASLALLSFTLPYPFLIIISHLLIIIALVWQYSRQPHLFECYLIITVGIMLWLLFRSLLQLQGQSHFDQNLSLIQQQILISLNLLLWITAILIHSHNMAYLDELTGLSGRRALNQRLMALGRRHTVAMLDIDHFKQFNDTYGHDVGDQVLQLVASKLRQVRGGTAYRYGGEEFCIIFPGKAIEQSLPALEEVRQNIEAAQMHLRGQQRPKNSKQGKKMRGKTNGKQKSVSVTISIGAAQRQPKVNSIKQADKALYKAKENGRNCICY
ncbi:diguanylate cyclase [Motiliproteus sp. MSK22-1]|uniref:GGDEF domain-containing protein n=1 Tax=Motiliproteus sp. MSK22-1 TaxID=1897630 RepID=UPI0009779A47|nr:GGDEF domain-containing protein [Motiliproteus sp. MSK22-1]OMH30269.1 hypothetical protein BGP75_17915 [Motiliproteus sp. MSK22-1]